MNKLLKLSLLGLAFIAAGCKVETELEAKHSELFGEAQTEKLGTLLIEVPSCKHYEDSRKESSSLVKLKEAVQKYLPETDYKECFSQKMTSYAQFNIPYAVGGKPTDVYKNIKVLMLETNPGEPPNQVAVMVTKKFKAALKDIQKENMTSNLKPSLTINYLNDSQDTYITTPMSVWMNGTPVVIGSTEAPPNGSATFKLSEIHSDILTGDNGQQISIFLFGYSKK